MSPSDRPSRISLIWLVVAVAYWLLLCVATHWPRTISGLDVGYRDKIVHFGAYAVLAILVATAWASRVGHLGWSALVCLVLVLTIYGAFDEISQPPFGRNCNIYDWLADVAGATAGAICFAILGNRFVTRGMESDSVTVPSAG